jgi:hypothetical protein
MSSLELRVVEGGAGHDARRTPSRCRQRDLGRGQRRHGAGAVDGCDRTNARRATGQHHLGQRQRSTASGAASLGLVGLGVRSLASSGHEVSRTLPEIACPGRGWLPQIAGPAPRLPDIRAKVPALGSGPSQFSRRFIGIGRAARCRLRRRDRSSSWVAAQRCPRGGRRSRLPRGADAPSALALFGIPDRARLAEQGCLANERWSKLAGHRACREPVTLGAEDLARGSLGASQRLRGSGAARASQLTGRP